MKLQTKQIAVTGILLAICIASQFFKNASVYITGPIVNATIILAACYCGPVCGLILCVIAPVTSFFITGSPIMAAIPALIPCIMAGNAALALTVSVFLKKKKGKAGFIAGVILGSCFKGALMGILISLILLPNFLPAAMQPKLTALQFQFSLTQLITALIGGCYAWIIRQAVKDRI